MSEKDKKNQTPTEGTSTDDNDLQKSLNENLEAMTNLMKSKSDHEIREMMKDEKMRKKMKKCMKEYEDDDEEEENEEKSKMKKSFKNIVSENEEVIDAVPVLKAFVDVLSNVVDGYQMIKSEIADLKGSNEQIMDIQKSFSEVMSSGSEMIKSMQGSLEKVGSAPLPRKGVINKSDLLQKSFGEQSNEKNESKYTPAEIKNALLKSAQEKEISGGVLTKYELSHYNPAMVDNVTMSKIQKHLPEKKEVN